MACRTAKDMLYAWLGQRKVQPKYVTKMQGQEQTSGFVSDLNVPKYGLRTKGFGGTKKEAEESAAKNCIEQLKKSGSWEGGLSPKHRVADSAARVAPDSPGCMTQWIKVQRLPNQDSKSYLNILLAKNHVTDTSYKTDGSDGGFKSRLTFTLPSGSVIIQEAIAPSKAKAETLCATAAIDKLQAKHLACVEVPGARAAVQADTPNPSVRKCLSAPIADFTPEPTPSPKEPAVAHGTELPSLMTSLKLAGEVIASSLEPFLGSASANARLSVPATTKSPANIVIYNYGSQQIHQHRYQPEGMNSDASSATAHNYEWPPSAVSRERTSASLGTPIWKSKYAGLAEDGRVITERVILRVGRQLGSLRKTVALDLGLTEADVQNCGHNEQDPYEINRRLLQMWLEQESANATVGRLCKVLWVAEAYDALDALHSTMAHTPTM